MVARYIIPIVLAIITLVSCNSEPTLQEYLVEKQSDKAFLKVDLATSLLLSKDNSLSEDQNDILKTVKKVNVVAFPIKDGNIAEYEIERSIVKSIMADEKYQTLTEIKNGKNRVSLKYVGKEDAIDEVIVFAGNSDKGFALLRLLGDNMKIDDMMKLAQNMNSKDLDLSNLDNIGNIFDL